MAEVKPAPDWERIEADYRAGLLSLREIAAEYGITEGAIRKRAKRDGWERDLSAKIAAKAESLVRKEAVRSEVRSEPCERQIVDANAETQANIRISHRKDISRSRALVMKMFGELEQTTDNAELFAQVGEILAQGDDARMGDLVKRIAGVPGRIDSVKKLNEALKTVIALEREAYGIAPVTQKTEIAGEGGTPIALNIIGVRPAER